MESIQELKDTVANQATRSTLMNKKLNSWTVRTTAFEFKIN